MPLRSRSPEPTLSRAGKGAGLRSYAYCAHREQLDQSS